MWWIAPTASSFRPGLWRRINWIEGIDKKGNLLGRNEPVVGQTKVLCPSIGGGRSWNHGAYSPRTGWFYTTGLEWCQEVTAQKEEPREGDTYFGGAFKLRHPEGEDAHSHLDAYDPVTGKKFWTYRAKYMLLASASGNRRRPDFHRRPGGQFLLARCEDR